MYIVGFARSEYRQTEARTTADLDTRVVFKSTLPK